MRLKRIMIAAPGSGSGKTTITCALLQALIDMGQQVVSYKCGSDYIDPMFHQTVIGIPSKNLDTFFTGAEETRALLLNSRSEEELAVLEGVMGLFDGLGGIREEGSSYHLAKVTQTPVVLVIDARGMGRSVVPLIAGFLSYDQEHLIRGVILNRMSGSYYETVKPLIEKELQVRVLGYVPDRRELYIGSRHLGLKLPHEVKDLRQQIREAAEAFRETVSVEGIMEIAGSAGELTDSPQAAGTGERTAGQTGSLAAAGMIPAADPAAPPVIAVARDEAFCFYYEDNLRLLREYGGKLIYFSPLHDTGLPRGCHALLIGGGYPELYAEALSGNASMRRAVRRALENGMPAVAECGGFMYLHDSITDQAGKSHAMAGVLPGSCTDTGRLVRFGYVEIEEKQSRFLPEGERIRGHEFHYYDSPDNGDGCLAVRPASGREYPCIIERENVWLGFPHLYYPSNPAFAKSLVEKAEAYKKRME